MHFERTERRAKQVQLTALVDVVFQLVIFFMLTTSFVQIHSLELSLPGKKSGGNAAEGATPILLDVASNGDLYWQRSLVHPTTLRARLSETMASDKAARVLVRSGESVSVQKLVSVLDQVYLAGVKNVAVDKWDERDLPRLEPTPEERERAAEEEERSTPILQEEDVRRLSPQIQFENMLGGEGTP
jgi:biopolymer transport protein ExbD